MTETVAPGVHRIEIPLPRTALRALNVYLLRGTPRNLLIDTGFNMPECREALYSGLAELSVPENSLDLFLTHLHTDHCGLSVELAARPGTTVYAGAEDGADVVRMAADAPAFWRVVLDDMARYGCPQELMRTVAATHPGMTCGPKGDISISYVSEGDVLRYGDAVLRVLAVPGHTPGHMALYDEGRRILFSGDFILSGAASNTPHWPQMPDPLGVFLHSLDEVYGMDMELVLPGHGKLLRDARKRMDDLRIGRTHRLDETAELLRGKELTAAELAPLIHWSGGEGHWESFMPAQQWFAIQDVLAYLEHLEVLGRTVRTERGGLIRFSTVC
ncbi:MAG: MBL fold metallo-hydrolase [Desulfovibrio sp.]|jgi:glyoxylase-like metal-dependent hydrolase (beta-lactamase superfamily II)|nr:MBL fold metallo-hydrolase [Desulfovibrio sp.]